MKHTLLAFLFLIPFAASAQLRVTNELNEPVVVAYAMLAGGKGFKGWFSQGWYQVAPNETVQLNSAVGTNDYVYYYARGVQSGREYSGNMKLLVDDKNAFNLRNCNMGYVAQQNPSLRWRSFRAEKIGNLSLRHTIHLRY